MSTIDNTNREFGAAVRAERKRAGLTQTELGKHAGCSHKFVLELERGKKHLRLDKVFAVLHVLGLSLELVRGKGAIRVSEELIDG